MNIKDKNKIIKTIKTCRFCHMCKIACTVGNITKNESNYPHGKALSLSFILDGIMKYDLEIAERMYQCAMCGRCKDWCISDYDIPAIILNARKEIVEKGIIPENVSNVYENIKKYGNPFGINCNSKKINKNIKKYSSNNKEKVDVLIFIGDSYKYYPNIFYSLEKILKSFNKKFVVLKKENCNIKLLYELGFTEDAKSLAAENIKNINQVDCDFVVTVDADEYFALKRIYPILVNNLVINKKIFHISEYINMYLNIDKKISYYHSETSDTKKKRILTYHDPSSLGRNMSIFEEPRKIINRLKGNYFVEMEWNRNSALCCGSGGGLLVTNKDIAIKAANKVIDEAKKIKASVIITTTPHCKYSIEKALKYYNENDLFVLDLVEILAEAI